MKRTKFPYPPPSLQPSSSIYLRRRFNQMENCISAFDRMSYQFKFASNWCDVFPATKEHTNWIGYINIYHFQLTWWQYPVIQKDILCVASAEYHFSWFIPVSRCERSFFMFGQQFARLSIIQMYINCGFNKHIDGYIIEMDTEKESHR